MPTKAELKVANKPIKLKIRTGDKVKIIAGKDKGEIGYVIKVAPREGKALVVQDNPDNPEQPIPLNQIVKHRKARYQGERSSRDILPAPINISNLMVLDPKTGEPTRVGRKKEGDKIVRYAKKSGEVFKDAQIYTKVEKES